MIVRQLPQRTGALGLASRGPVASATWAVAW